MVAIADEDALYHLEFVDRRGLDREVERLRQKTKSAIIPGSTLPIRGIEREMYPLYASLVGDRSFDITLFCRY